MRVFITLLCMAAVSLALPNKRLPGNNVAETISRTVDMANIRDIMKRSMEDSVIKMSFDLTDSNKDGHITASEFASYYVNNFDVGMTRNKWINEFQAILPHIDSNGNGTLELDDYALLVEMLGK